MFNYSCMYDYFSLRPEKKSLSEEQGGAMYEMKTRTSLFSCFSFILVKGKQVGKPLYK